MPTNPIRLLLSARDPAAAMGIAAVARAAMADSRFQPDLVAAPPGLGWLRSQELPVRDASGDPMTAARAVLESGLPDLALVGLSGPEPGLDEALCALLAGCVPCYALQDYWGDVNPGYGHHADTYLVPDATAAALTRQKTAADIQIVGWPRYAGFRADGAWPGDRPDGPLLVWFGQPLWSFAGYAVTLSLLADALHLLPDQPRLFYRPHPKENDADIARAVDILAGAPAFNGLLPAMSAATALVNADLILSCLSSVALDLAMLNARAAAPLGVSASLLLTPDIRSWAGPDRTHPPLLKTGLTLAALSPDALVPTLREGLLADTRRHFWHHARTTLSGQDGAPACVLDILATRGER
ncbi:hypothetical protein [Niveispirillum fermenti]|uniref:hypothetical protein n=1 Tax=Niveispirillum fermenti TaxID=1233113 RepID=UPI003A88C33F